MSPILAPPETLADLMHRLGDIPAERVRMQPLPGLATEADVLANAAAPRKRICELIDGVLVEKPMGFRESGLASWIMTLLGGFIYPRNLGILTGEQGAMRLFAGRVRIPDVAFISWGRTPGGCWPEEPIPDLAPDLAVEILSPSNTVAEMDLKRQDYFRSGVLLVWEIDPTARTVEVYTMPGHPLVLRETDLLDGGAVLPGFTLSVRDLFAELDRRE
jgi:Uma2 family endonuclease